MKACTATVRSVSVLPSEEGFELLVDPATGVEVIVGRGCFRVWHMVHERYLFSLIEDAHIVSRYRRSDYEHVSGDLAICEPGEAHRNRSVRGNGDFSAIFVPPAVVEELLGLREPHFRASTRGRFDPGEPIRAYLRLLRAPASPVEREEALLGAALAAFGAFGERAAPGELPQGSRAVHRCRELLRARRTEQIGLDELARETGVTKSSLVRAFRREIGMTPVDYLMRLRVNHAMRRLDRGARVMDTGAESGFCDQSHMNRWFKKVIGITPGQYAVAVRGDRQP